MFFKSTFEIQSLIFYHFLKLITSFHLFSLDFCIIYSFWCLNFSKCLSFCCWSLVRCFFIKNILSKLSRTVSLPIKSLPKVFQTILFFDILLRRITSAVLKFWISSACMWSGYITFNSFTFGDLKTLIIILFNSSVPMPGDGKKLS